MEYTVMLRIDVDAPDPLAAAAEAHRLMVSDIDGQTLYTWEVLSTGDTEVEIAGHITSITLDKEGRVRGYDHKPAT